MIITVNVTEPSYLTDRSYAGAVRIFSNGLWVDYVGTLPTDAEIQAFAAQPFVNRQESGGYTIPTLRSVVVSGYYEVASGDVLDIAAGAVLDII